MYHTMRWDPEHPHHHGSDRLILSEGHAVPIVYAAWKQGCRRLSVVTTNDNVRALGFYQRRGFVLTALRARAVEKSRRLKPEIPELGFFGIPIRDELELMLDLRTGRA